MSEETKNQNIQIIEFRPEHRADFERLNLQWIKQHWELEDADRKVLGDPQSAIIDTGGRVLLAQSNDAIIGTCALIAMGDQEFELAKMSVDEQHRGLGIGEQLARATIELARSLGASRIMLESNSRLTPALSLYRKLGFKDVDGAVSEYLRCNVQMELLL